MTKRKLGLSAFSAAITLVAVGAYLLNILQFTSEARLPNSCLVVGGVPNCDGDPGPEDAIIDLRVLAGLKVTVPAGCPAPGEHAEH